MAQVGSVIIGSGLIAKFHANAVKASEKTFLVGVYDAVPERAEAFAKEFECKAFTSLDDALSAEGVGLCLVATPSGAHDEAVFAAARHKVPVLVEKPLSITLERAQKMIDACKEAGVQLGGIFQTRWDEAFVEAKRKINSGELGKITYASIRVPWWRDDEYYTKSAWHGTWAVDGGGALINQSIHMVDWLVALMPRITDVKAFCATLAHPMETEDTVSAALRFEGGALGGIYAATSSYPGRGKFIEVTGTKGTLVLDDDKTAGSASPDSFPYTGHQLCIESFVDSIQGGEPFPVPGEEAIKSIELIERIYKDAGIK
jgi:predicted dehydrogenase